MKEVIDRLREIASQLERGELSAFVAGTSLDSIARSLRVGPSLPPDYTHYHYSQPLHTEESVQEAERDEGLVLRRP